MITFSGNFDKTDMYFHISTTTVLVGLPNFSSHQPSARTARIGSFEQWTLSTRRTCRVTAGDCSSLKKTCRAPITLTVNLALVIWRPCRMRLDERESMSVTS